MNDKERQEWIDTFACFKKGMPSGAYEHIKAEVLEEYPELEGAI